MLNQSLVEALAKAFLKTFPVPTTRNPNDHHRDHFVQEYSAQNAHVSIEEDARALTEGLGYELILKSPDAAYLIYGQHRVAIIQPRVAEHESWCTSTRANFQLLYEVLYRSLEFQAGQEEMDAEKMYALFTHEKTGQLIQITWRKKPIFPNLFHQEAVTLHA